MILVIIMSSFPISLLTPKLFFYKYFNFITVCILKNQRVFKYENLEMMVTMITLLNV